METKVLSQLDRELKRGFYPRVPMELNQKEVELLLFVHAFANESMGFYGKEIGMEKGSFTYLADLLVQKNLIIMIENPKDSRSKLLDLTKSGKNMAQEIRNQLDVHMKERMSIFSEYELLQFKLVVETSKMLLMKLHESRYIEPKE